MERETRALTHLSAHKGDAQFEPATFDPASKYLYYLTNEGTEFTRLRRYSLAAGAHEDVERADWDITFASFSRGGRYRVTGVNRDGRAVISVVDTTTGKPVALPAIPNGGVGGVSIARSESKLAFYLNGDRSPNDLHVLQLGSARHRSKLTSSLNPEIDPADLVDTQVVRFKARDGVTVPNILWKPHQATPSAKAPALVFVHGGPGGQTTSGYSGMIQYFVNHGYVVLGINNRGSSGYGKTFFAADDRKHGKEPLWDCVDAKAYLASLPYVDPGPHRHHGRQLRRLHGAGRAGVPAGRVRRRRGHLRRVELAAHARRHSGLVGGAAQGALRRTGRPGGRREDALRGVAGVPRREDQEAADRAAGRQRSARPQGRVRRRRRGREEERGARGVHRLCRTKGTGSPRRRTRSRATARS